VGRLVSWKIDKIRLYKLAKPHANAFTNLSMIIDGYMCAVYRYDE